MSGFEISHGHVWIPVGNTSANWKPLVWRRLLRFVAREVDTVVVWPAVRHGGRSSLADTEKMDFHHVKKIREWTFRAGAW
jgi:hypothetical protein